MKAVSLSILALATLGSALVARDPASNNGGKVDKNFVCAQASDCTIVQRKNHCGPYPVCARPNAVFPADNTRESGGTMGICGHRVVSACACNDGVCAAANDDSDIGDTLGPV